MSTVKLELGLSEALDLFLRIREDEAELGRIRTALRDFLYEELTVEELEDAVSRHKAGDRDRAAPRGQGRL